MSTTPTPQPTAEELKQQIEATQAAVAETQQQEQPPVAQKMVVETATGQKFIGQTQSEVIAEMKKSIENASAELKRLHEIEKTWKQQPAPELSPEQVAEQQAQTWMLEQTAKGLGFSNAEELRTAMNGMKESAEEMRQNRIVAEFHNKHQDFPADKDAAAKLTEVMEREGLPFSVGGLGAAHKIAVAEGMYQPAPQAQQFSTPKPLPSAPSTSPNVVLEKDPNQMTAAEIRAILEANR